MAQPQGEAAGYYNEPQLGYQGRQAQEIKSGYAPPTYGQDFHMAEDHKQSFEQTFKVEKPKLNDLWAGILVSRMDSSSTFLLLIQIPSSLLLSSSDSSQSRA